MSNGSVKSDEGGNVKAGAKYTEAEWQQMLLGLKRENKENVERLRKEHDEDLFKVRFHHSDQQQLFDFYCLLSVSFFLSDSEVTSLDKSSCKFDMRKGK